MKYLKEYNSHTKNITKSEFEEIQDLFQDLIDEYNLELYTENKNIGPTYNYIGYINSMPVYDKSGYSSTNRDFFDGNMDVIELGIFTPTIEGENKPFDDEGKILIDVTEFIKRLKLMGYITEVEMPTDFKWNYSGYSGIDKNLEFIYRIGIKIKHK